MPIRNYPFLSIVRTGPNSGKVVVQGPQARPRLWIRIINPDKNLAIEYPALVDTGADTCACPAYIASQLGHKLYSVQPKRMKTAKGDTPAYPHTSTIEILEVQPNGLPGPQVLYTIPKTTIDFTKGLPEFLLGRQHFLDYASLRDTLTARAAIQTFMDPGPERLTIRVESLIWHLLKSLAQNTTSISQNISLICMMTLRSSMTRLQRLTNKN